MSTPGGMIRCFLVRGRESSLALLAVCPSGCRGSQSGRSSTKACRGPFEGVIYNVVTTPLAVGRQVRFDAMAHGGSGHIRRQLADQVGAVGVAMPGGIEDQLLPFCLVLLPQILPVPAPAHVQTQILGAVARPHRR